MNRLNKRSRTRRAKQRGTDIDYNKLALAIVKAKNMIDEEKGRDVEKDKVTRAQKLESLSICKNLRDYYDKFKNCFNNRDVDKLLKDIGKFFNILLNLILFPSKFYFKNTMLGNLLILSTLLVVVYKVLSFFLFVFILLIIIVPFTLKFNIVNYLIALLLVTLFSLFRSGLSIACKEIEESKDIYFISNLFSSIVSCVAAIAAIVTVIISLMHAGAL